MFRFRFTEKIFLTLFFSLTLGSVRTFATELPNKSTNDAAKKTSNQAYVKEFDLDDFDFWADQCRLFAEEESYEEIIKTCEKAISLKPRKENADLWFARSYALFKLGDYLNAITSYNRVLEVSPKSSISMAYQCAALFQLNRYDDAIDSCESALQVNGIWGKKSPAIAWYYRGLSLQATNRLEIALESFIRAVTIDPNDDVAKAGLCGLEVDLHPFFYEFSEYDIARRLNTIQQTIGGDPNKTINLFDILQADIPDDKKFNYVICSLETATILYERALASEPKNATLWMQQGLLLEQLGKYQQALTSYDQAVNLLPDYAIALAHKCAVLVQLNDYESALEFCEMALESNNNWGRQGETIGSAYGWTQKSAALIGLGKYEDALAAAERAIAIAPEYSVAWNNKAVSQWHLNKLNEKSEYQQNFNPNISIEKAISLYEQTLEKYQDDFNIQGEAFELEYYTTPIFFHRSQIIALFNQARILASNNNLSKAIESYQKALDLDRAQQNSWGFSLIDEDLAANIRINQATASILEHQASSCAANSQNLSQAISYAKEATVIKPDLFTTWYTLGLAQLHACSFEAAEGNFKEALSKSPNNIHAMTALGIILARTNQRQEAIKTFERVLNIDPDYLLASHCREYLVIVSRPSSADNICTRWMI